MHVEWTTYTADGPKLLKRAEEALVAHEAMNNVLYSVLGGRRELEFAFAIVDDSMAVRLVGGKNFGKPLAMSLSTDAAVLEAGYRAALARPGWTEFTGEKGMAWELATRRANQVVGVARTMHALGVYGCERVVRPVGVEGRRRLAGPGDVALLARWWEAFGGETHHEVLHDGWEQATAAVAEGRWSVWEVGGAVVSVCAWAGPTPNGIRVNFVYTPGEKRGRGYASANVADLTGELLRGGKRVVFLFTDLGNPTSNKIYRAMGYEWVGESAHVVVEAGAGGGA